MPQPSTPAEHGVAFSTSVPAIFVASPQAFSSAPADIRNVMKLEQRTVVENDSEVNLEISTDRALIDFSGLDLAAFDPRAVIADCDLLKSLALAHSDELVQIIAALQKGTWEGVEEAEATAAALGATEEDFVNKGGGLVGLLLAAAALVLSGCISSNNKAKNTTTTPRKPTRTGGGPN